jgi:hypothetical protein
MKDSWLKYLVAMFYYQAWILPHIVRIDELYIYIYVIFVGYCGHQFGYFSGQLGDGKSGEFFSVILVLIYVLSLGATM